MNWKRILENTVSIFFAITPIAIVLMSMWFIILFENTASEATLADYQESLKRVEDKTIDWMNEQKERIDVLSYVLEKEQCKGISKNSSGK